VTFYRRECSNITAIIHPFSQLIPIRTLLVWQLLLCVVLRRPWPTFRAVAQWCKERPSVQHSRNLGHSYQSDIMIYNYWSWPCKRWRNCHVLEVAPTTKSWNVFNYVRDAKRPSPENESLFRQETLIHYNYWY